MLQHVITEIQVYDGSGVDPNLHLTVFVDIISTDQSRGYRQMTLIFYAEADMRAALKTLKENPEIGHLEIVGDAGVFFLLHHVKTVRAEDFSGPWRIRFQFNCSGMFPFPRQP